MNRNSRGNTIGGVLEHSTQSQAPTACTTTAVRGAYRQPRLCYSGQLCARVYCTKSAGAPLGVAGPFDTFSKRRALVRLLTRFLCCKNVTFAHCASEKALEHYAQHFPMTTCRCNDHGAWRCMSGTLCVLTGGDKPTMHSIRVTRVSACYHTAPTRILPIVPGAPIQHRRQ